MPNHRVRERTSLRILVPVTDLPGNVFSHLASMDTVGLTVKYFTKSRYILIPKTWPASSVKLANASSIPLELAFTLLDHGMSSPMSIRTF